jgi:hypothetical protein
MASANRAPDDESARQCIQVRPNLLAGFGLLFEQELTRVSQRGNSRKWTSSRHEAARNAAAQQAPDLVRVNPLWCGEFCLEPTIPSTDARRVHGLLGGARAWPCDLVEALIAHCVSSSCVLRGRAVDKRFPASLSFRKG